MPGVETVEKVISHIYMSTQPHKTLTYDNLNTLIGLMLDDVIRQ